LHGTWVTDRKTGKSQEIVHDWLPLNDLGTYRADQRPKHEGDFYPFPRHWLARCEISSAFVAYFNQIPARIRRVVGQLRGHQWLALDLIWQVPEFAWFLDEEIASGRRHYFHACVELAGAERMSRLKRGQFAQTLMSEKRAGVLTGLTGIRHSKRSHRLFSKVTDPEPWQESSYRNLLEIASTSPGAKAFSHAKKIEHEGISYWLSLPLQLKTINLLRLFVSDTSLIEHFNDEVGDIFWNISGDFLQRFRDSLIKITSHDNLFWWPYINLHALISTLPLPQPPIAGSEQLIPLRSSHELRIEALKMHNCLEAEYCNVLSGNRYYFHWDGSEHATVMLERNSEGEWQFGQILGPRNIKVSRQTRLYVEAMVEAQLPSRKIVSCKPDAQSFGPLQKVLLANDNLAGPNVAASHSHDKEVPEHRVSPDVSSTPRYTGITRNTEAQPEWLWQLEAMCTETGDCMPCLVT